MLLVLGKREASIRCYKDRDSIFKLLLLLMVMVVKVSLTVMMMVRMVLIIVMMVLIMIIMIMMVVMAVMLMVTMMLLIVTMVVVMVVMPVRMMVMMRMVLMMLVMVLIDGKSKEGGVSDHEDDGLTLLSNLEKVSWRQVSTLSFQAEAAHQCPHSWNNRVLCKVSGSSSGP